MDIMKARPQIMDMQNGKVVIVVNRDTQNNLFALATQRNGSKAGWQNKRSDPDQTDVSLHYVGIKAEWAVAQFLMLKLDTSVLPRGDAGWDLEAHDLTIDVKYSQDDLKFFPPGPKSDIVFLVQPYSFLSTYEIQPRHIQYEHDPRVTKVPLSYSHVVIVGWTTREKYIRESYIANLGYGERMFLAAWRLQPAVTFLEYAKKKAPRREPFL